MAGRKPFAEIRSELQVLTARHQGRTLNHPGHCSAQLFDLIRECWLLDLHQRPTMDVLLEKVKRLALLGVLWRPQDPIAQSSLPAPETLPTMQTRRYPLLGKQHTLECHNGSTRGADGLKPPNILSSSTYAASFPGFKRPDSMRDSVWHPAAQDTVEFLSASTTPSHMSTVTREGHSWSTLEDTAPYAQSVDVFAVAASQGSLQTDFRPTFREHQLLPNTPPSRTPTTEQLIVLLPEEEPSESASYQQGADLVSIASTTFLSAPSYPSPFDSLVLSKSSYPLDPSARVSPCIPMDLLPTLSIPQATSDIRASMIHPLVIPRSRTTFHLPATERNLTRAGSEAYVDDVKPTAVVFCEQNDYHEHLEVEPPSTSDMHFGLPDSNTLPMTGLPSSKSCGCGFALTTPVVGWPASTQKNGTRDDTLIPINTPIESHTYTMPSATLPNDVPATFTLKRARSQAFRHDDEGDAVPSPTEGKQIVVEAKRLKSLLSLERSHMRKAEHLRMLDDHAHTASSYGDDWVDQSATTGIDGRRRST
jgi:hypothetical protein